MASQQPIPSTEPIVLAIPGDGPMAKALHKLADHYEIDDLTAVGMVALRRGVSTEAHMAKSCDCHDADPDPIGSVIGRELDQLGAVVRQIDQARAEYAGDLESMRERAVQQP